MYLIICKEFALKFVKTLQMKTKLDKKLHLFVCITVFYGWFWSFSGCPHLLLRFIVVLSSLSMTGNVLRLDDRLINEAGAKPLSAVSSSLKVYLILNPFRFNDFIQFF
jgi:hypothetical protein